MVLFLFLDVTDGKSVTLKPAAFLITKPFASVLTESHPALQAERRARGDNIRRLRTLRQAEGALGASSFGEEHLVARDQPAAAVCPSCPREQVCGPVAAGVELLGDESQLCSDIAAGASLAPAMKRTKSKGPLFTLWVMLKHLERFERKKPKEDVVVQIPKGGALEKNPRYVNQERCRVSYWEEHQGLGTEHLVKLWRQNRVGDDACLVVVVVPQVNEYISDVTAID
nr:PREDICTED: uncharacterized protein LOC104643899 [Balearica regulorum gibbericeps]